MMDESRFKQVLRTKCNCSRTAIFDLLCANALHKPLNSFCQITEAHSFLMTGTLHPRDLHSWKLSKLLCRYCTERLGADWGKWKEKRRKSRKKHSAQLKFTGSFPAQGLSKLNKTTQAATYQTACMPGLYFISPSCLRVRQRGLTVLGSVKH